MRIFAAALLLSLLSLVNGVAQSVIVNRGALNALLGAQRADEGFETLPLADFSGISSDGLLSSTNAWAGMTGLIMPGVTIESSFSPKENGNGYFIQWKGHGNAGSITKTIAAGEGIIIDFWNSTAAFGVDLKDYAARRVFVAGVTVYGPDDSSVIYSSTNIPIADPAIGTFFGLQADQGIGSAHFYPVVEGFPGYSPTIDNLTFGVVPEPSTVWLTLLGVSSFAFRMRRK